MTTAVRALGLIPARAGSKGIVGKNLRPLGGRPLVVRSIDVARASGVLERIVVTTESSEIARVAREAGAEVPFLRPSDLATDDAPMLPVVQHAVAALEAGGWSPDAVVLLQPTAPLRTPEHVRSALGLLVREGCDSVVSVVAVPRHFAPHFVFRVDGSGRLTPFMPDAARYTRRQDVPAAYSRDGTVYAFWRRVLERGTLYGDDVRPLILSPEESVNLDEPDDWARAESMLARTPA